jgi:hypothetical protein
MQLNPNPTPTTTLNCQLNLPFSGKLQCRLVNMLGQEITNMTMPAVPAGPYQCTLDLSTLTNTQNFQGVWIVTLSNEQQQVAEAQPFMMIR